MEVKFVAEFKSIDRISPLVWELEHIVGKDKAHTLVQTPCKLMVESWRNGISAIQRTADPSPLPQMKCASTEISISRPF